MDQECLQIRNERRIGWLKLTPGQLAAILRGESHYKGLAVAHDLEIIDVKIVGLDAVPIVMIGVSSSILDEVQQSELVAPTIPINPEPSGAA